MHKQSYFIDSKFLEENICQCIRLDLAVYLTKQTPKSQAQIQKNKMKSIQIYIITFH